MKKIYILLLFLLVCSNANCTEKKYNLSICSVFKNEAPYLKEWIEYHRIIGADHFYLYDNESSDGYQEILKPYIHQGIVTLIDWPDQKSDLPEDKDFRWVHSTQETAFVQCGQNRINETKWLAFIDVDEFILPIKVEKFTEILKQYEDAPGVTLSWHSYGTSHWDTLPKNKLLIEALHMTFPQDHFLSRDYMKSIVKTEAFIGFYWVPHDCKYKNDMNGTEIPKEIARINHYIIRSNEAMRAKIAGRKKCSNRDSSESEIHELVKSGNALEDKDRLILRYAKELRSTLGLDKDK